ncbi:MAG: hypothetical protein ACLT8H_09655 [Streptococcus parasanguinis]
MLPSVIRLMWPTGKVWFIPEEWRLDGYLRLIEQPLFLRSYLNTILYTVVGTISCSGHQYPSWLRICREGPTWLRNGSASLFIVPMFVSGGLIPIYLTVKQCGTWSTPSG